MAIGTPTAPTAMVSAASGTVTTGSFTPAANIALFAFVTARRTGSAAVTPTVSDSGGLTWSALDNVNYDPGSNPRMAGQLYVAFPGASPSAMTVTCTSTGASQTAVNVVSVTGASVTAGDYTNHVVGSVNTTGDPTATLGSSPAASSGVIGHPLMHATNTIPPPTGFTQIEENTAATAYRVETSYDITSPTAGAHTWASSNTTSFGFLVEVPEPSAGAYSMVASAGSFALTGTNAGLAAARKMTASTGSFTLTGTAVALRRGYSMAASAGTFTLTGTAAGLRANRKLVAASASYALTGSTVALKAGRKLTAGAGAFTLTGLDVTLTYATGYTMTAGAATFVLTGANVALKRAAKLTAGAGSFALTGDDVTLTYTQLDQTIRVVSGNWNELKAATSSDWDEATSATSGNWLTGASIASGTRGQGITVNSGNWTGI